MVLVKRAIETKILGYSADFRKTHLIYNVEFIDETFGIRYRTNTRNDEGFVNIGDFTKQYPLVEVPIEAPWVKS